MMKNKFNLIVMMFIFVLLLGTVQAAGFGSSQKNTYSLVKKGETAEFTILFWNIMDSSIPIRVKTPMALTTDDTRMLQVTTVAKRHCWSNTSIMFTPWDNLDV